MTNNQNTQVEELQRVVIKEELMALIETYYGRKNGIHMRAAFLNNLVFWQSIQLKTDKKERNKIERAIQNNVSKSKIEKMKNSYRNGWFYKTSEDHLEELMGFCSPASITRMNKEFAEQGWLKVGKNPDPKKKWDKSTWYRLDLKKINDDLNKLGYHLEGFKFSANEEKETPSDSIFHGENTNEPATDSIFHHENFIFHGENSSFHHERAIPEGFTEGLSESIEEEEIITLNHITSFLNEQITKREITNPKTLTAIFEVAEKCKAIGTTDRESMQNYCIKVVEDKMSKFGQKQKAVKPSVNGTTKPIRKEKLPEWYKEEANNNPVPAAKTNSADQEQKKQKIEDMLKQLRSAANK